MQFCSYHLEQLPPKTTSKDLITVSDDGFWQSMQLVYVIQKTLSYYLSCEGMSEHNKVAKLGESVNDHQYGIITL